MSELEKRVARKRRLRNLQLVVLRTIAVAGVISVTAVAPQALAALVQLGIIPRTRQKEFIRAARDRLLKKGLVKYSGGNLCTTAAGHSYLHRLELSEIVRRAPRRWDGKWRVLIFDIPETRRALREKMRNTLSAIGFMQLQKSVWIFPYDCEILVTLLKADLRIGREMLYLIVDALEHDDQLRRSFGLKSK